MLTVALIAILTSDAMWPVNVPVGQGQTSLHAAVRGRDVYVGTLVPWTSLRPEEVRAPDSLVSFGYFGLWFAPLSGDDRPRLFAFYDSRWGASWHWSGDKPNPLRWRVTGDQLSVMSMWNFGQTQWPSCFRGRITTAPLIRALCVADDLIDANKETIGIGPGYRLAHFESEKVRDRKPEFETDPYDQLFREMLNHDRLTVHMDYLTDPPDHCVMIYITDSGKLYSYFRGAKDSEAAKGWSRLPVMPAPWDGPFQVFADASPRDSLVDRKHFVVSGGRVFSSDPDKRRSAPVSTWLGSPVLAVVTDADDGTSWAFTRDEYFPLRGTKFEPRPHTLGPLPLDSPRSQFDAAFKRAQLLRPGIRPR